MKSQYPSNEIPDFLVKTTFGCSIVFLLLIIPFAIIQFTEGYVMVGVSTSALAVASLVNIWYGLRGSYSLAYNTYVTMPLGAIVITYTLVKLSGPGSYWPFLLVLTYYFVLPEKRAWVLNLATLFAVIPAAWVVLEPPLAIRFSAVMLGTSLFAFISMREINVLHALLKAEAVTDQLTGLLNRTILEDSLHHAIAQHKRTATPMTLVTFDIDHFKSINDTLGHHSGDEVLRKLGGLLRQRTRASDKIFRTGGEEFLIILFDATEADGLEVAESLRQEVASTVLLPDRQITVSLGVATLQDDMDESAWRKASDAQLYRAKHSGRNRVAA